MYDTNIKNRSMAKHNYTLTRIDDCVEMICCVLIWPIQLMCWKPIDGATVCWVCSSLHVYIQSTWHSNFVQVEFVVVFLLFFIVYLNCWCKVYLHSVNWILLSLASCFGRCDRSSYIFGFSFIWFCFVRSSSYTIRLSAPAENIGKFIFFIA